MGENYIIDKYDLRKLIKDSLRYEFNNKYGISFEYEFFLAKTFQYPKSLVEKIWNNYLEPGEDPNDEEVQRKVFENAGEDILIDLEMTKFRKA